MCIYCSESCELRADHECSARLACVLHSRLEREDTNLGESAAHLRMFPMYTTELTAKSESPELWEALKVGVAHFARLLIAVTPSKVYKKSLFRGEIIDGQRIHSGR